MQSVEQLMTRDVITVSPETPLAEVARILVEKSISGLPVVDADGKVVGIVSEGDFLAREAGHWSEASIDGKKEAKAARNPKADAKTAGEAMTSPVLTIEPFRAIRAVAEIMVTNHVNRLPVVDAEGKLLGIVSRADLVRAFVQSDAELEETIRKEVIIREMWLDPEKFDVKVVNGVAKVSGVVMKRSTAEVIGRLLAMVPGIVSVETSITWDLDDGGVTVP